jgi:transketolase
VRVLDIFSLKPLDVEGIRANIEAVGGNVLVVEEHYPEGGVRDAVCGAVPTSIKKLEHLCVREVPGSAKPEEQLEIYGVDHTAIYNKAKEMLL